MHSDKPIADLRNYVVTVDEKDNDLGIAEKMQAHRQGVLHRALSVFIFNTKGEWLLQKRASHKYHCRSMWSNTCCSHPMQGEPPLEAAHRRLREEMGMESILLPLFTFQYKAELDTGLIEHELDHIFVGISNELPNINREEVQEYRFVNLDLLKYELEAYPNQFTPWFKLLVPKFIEQQRQVFATASRKLAS